MKMLALLSIASVLLSIASAGEPKVCSAEEYGGATSCDFMIFMLHNSCNDDPDDYEGPDDYITDLEVGTSDGIPSYDYSFDWFESRKKRSAGKANNIFISRKQALDALHRSKRSVLEGENFVCECCINSCSVSEWYGYCSNRRKRDIPAISQKMSQLRMVAMREMAKVRAIKNLL